MSLLLNIFNYASRSVQLARGQCRCHETIRIIAGSSAAFPTTRRTLTSQRSPDHTLPPPPPPPLPPRSSSNLLWGILALTGIGTGYALFSRNDIFKELKAAGSPSSMPSTKDDVDGEDYKLWHKTVRQDLPFYSADDVQKHASPQSGGVWVSFGLGVYDITSYIDQHPGRDKILLAAGAAVDPFWAIYQQHITREILTLIETFRIGNLNPEDEVKVSSGETDSIWADEPKRHPLLKPTSKQPFNAEPPISLLAENFFTPNELFYVRNHLPVPNIDAGQYELAIDVETQKANASQKQKVLTLEDIKALPKHSVTAAVMCAGNRRSEMSAIKSVRGLTWGAGAVGNAKWSGARLRDVLLSMGIQPSEKLHVVFEGADLDPSSNPYGASIPLSKALDERGEVLLAYEMNDRPLNRDHGHPLRVIVPGIAGARSVKWLTRIAVSEEESESHWQRNDYKGFSPSTDWDNVDFTKAPAIQIMPVTSAICSPVNGEALTVDKDGMITVRGYAWSGGGRRIVRVDVTADHGKTWHVANLEQEDEPDGRHYGWTLWSIRVPAAKNGEMEIWTKAVDSAYNVQPESFPNIWNLRGVLSNAYHRVKVRLSY